MSGMTTQTSWETGHDAMRWSPTPPPPTLTFDAEVFRDIGRAMADLAAVIRDVVLAAWRRFAAWLKPLVRRGQTWSRKHHAHPPRLAVRSKLRHR